ncbi:MAG: c-type cytochrome [Xanthobacteraceae bacterium]
MNTSKSLISTVFSAALMCGWAVASAQAADDVASKAEVCGACHGQNGTPINTATPTIWGQQSNYLFKELHDFHSGARVNATMSPNVKDVALPDLRQLADYFAAKTWPAASGANAAAPPAAIADKIEMCKACHQPHFEGGAPAPRLAGLSSDYLLSAMNAFADGQRTNNLDLPGFMKVLSASDRQAIAKYLAGL